MNTENADELLMEIASLVLDPTTQAPIVVLKDLRSDTYLPIWIGVAEASSIATALRGLPSERPLSHDLMRCMISELGGSVRRVIIHKLEANTYFANIELLHADVVRLIDSRPSDAIALAVRLAAPIVVMRQVVETAQSRVQVGGDVVAGVSGDNGQDADTESVRKAFEEFSSVQEFGDHNLSAVDRERWAEILFEMGPDDFKYKM